jgi:UDP-N-acetylglucosamine 4,6-dehydratase
MNGGEIFVPKIPSAGIMAIAEAIAPECKTDVVGIRPGEKIHEVLISEDDGRHTLEYDGYFVIQPQFPWWGSDRGNGGRPVPSGFIYSSGKNPDVLNVEEIRRIVDEFDETVLRTTND